MEGKNAHLVYTREGLGEDGMLLCSAWPFRAVAQKISLSALTKKDCQGQKGIESVG
jgi:hypothetical protein